MAKHRKQLPDRFGGPAKFIEYLLARALVSLLQRLPVSLAHSLGRGLGWLAWRLMKRRRQIVTRNLQVVADFASTSSTSSPEIDRFLALDKDSQIREVFQRSAAHLLVGLAFQNMGRHEREKTVTYEGIDHVAAASAKEQGIIFLVVHMGPWEALAQITAAELGLKQPIQIGGFYRPLNNRYLDHWFRKQREAYGARMFSRIDGLHAPIKFLRKEGFLSIMVDQKMREGARVPFFGHNLPSNTLPGIFHRRTGAPMVSVSIRSTGPCQWCLRFRPVDLPTDSRNLDRETLARITTRAGQTVLLDSPLDGFWFQKRF